MLINIRVFIQISLVPTHISINIYIYICICVCGYGANLKMPGIGSPVLVHVPLTGVAFWVPIFPHIYIYTNRYIYIYIYKTTYIYMICRKGLGLNITLVHMLHEFPFGDVLMWRYREHCLGQFLGDLPGEFWDGGGVLECDAISPFGAKDWDSLGGTC